MQTNRNPSVFDWVATISPVTAMPPPARNHFSCWRSSPRRATEVHDLVRDHRSEAGGVRDDHRHVEDRRGSVRRRRQRRQRAGRVDHHLVVRERAEVLPCRSRRGTRPRRRRRPRTTHRQRPGGMCPSGKRTIGSGARTSTGIHAGASATASRPRGRCVVDSIDEHRVVGCVHAHEHGEREREQDPADRVPRPATGDDAGRRRRRGA